MAVSRAIMVPIMAALPNARSQGLSASVGRPSLQTAILAVALGGTIAIFSGAWPALIGAPFGGLAVAAIAKHKIGGQTGDILGASQQCAETCALICLVALL
jgi:adenosylcobinamide-GDP ribazoletransferase